MGAILKYYFPISCHIIIFFWGGGGCIVSATSVVSRQAVTEVFDKKRVLKLPKNTDEGVSVPLC